MMVAYDARALNPRHRHQGVGVMIENIVGRLRGKADFLGLAPRFDSEIPEKVVNWPSPLRKLDIFTFEISPIFTKRFDVYWGTNLALPQLSRNRTLLTFHDLLLFKFPGDQPWVRYVRPRVISSIRRATKIVADSKATADELLALFPEVKNKTEVIHLGFDRPAEKPPHNCDRDEDPYFVVLGAHRPRKNLQLAINALESLWHKGRKVRLIVTGGVHPIFQDQIVVHKSFVQHVGLVPRQKLFQLLAGAQALLFPSYDEGFGLPYLEAMAAGCPVIATDIPISREITGDAALLLPNDVSAWRKGLQLFLGDKSIRSELVRKGQANLEKFDWAKTANQYLEAMREVSR